MIRPGGGARVARYLGCRSVSAWLEEMADEQARRVEVFQSFYPQLLRRRARRAILLAMAKKPKPDFTQVAFRVVQQATRQAPAEEPKPLPAKAAAGRRGGLKGGKARAAKLTPEERSEAARKAAIIRWHKPKLE